jgi:hypothetical protein
LIRDGPKLPKTPKYEFTEFMDSPILPLDEIDTRADSLLNFEHRMSAPGTPLLTSRSNGKKKTGDNSLHGSRSGTAGPPSLVGSRKGSFAEDYDNEPMSGGQMSGQWSNSSVSSNGGGAVNGPGIDPDLEAFSNAAIEAMKAAGFDLRAMKEEPLSPGPTTPLPMLRKMSSRRKSSRSSKAMEAMIAQEEENNKKKEISEGATIGGAMLWSRMASAPRRVLMVTASADNEADGEEGANRVKAYKNLGLGACTVAELKVIRCVCVPIYYEHACVSALVVTFN